MKTWLTSFNGAITLSLIALLSVLMRSYLDTGYVLVEDYNALGYSFVVLWVLGYTAIIGGWMWALLVANKDRRGAWMALLGYALLTTLVFGAFSLLVFSNLAVELVVYGSNLVTGILASVAVGLQLWRILSRREISEQKGAIS